MNHTPTGLVGHHLTQKGHKLGRVVALGALPHDRPGPGVEGGTERQSPMTVVLEPVAWPAAPARAGRGLGWPLSRQRRTPPRAGGFRYRPMSAALRLKSGSS